MIEPVLFRLLESGGRNRKTKQAHPLSAKTVRHVASVLDVILKAAVKKKLRESNPMAGVELPKVEPKRLSSMPINSRGTSTSLDPSGSTRFCCSPPRQVAAVKRRSR